MRCSWICRHDGIVFGKIQNFCFDTGTTCSWTCLPDEFFSKEFTIPVISFSFNVDICTLTQSLPCCCLPCCLFFSSSACPQTDTAQLYNTHPDSCTHMDRTGLEFNLSLRYKNISHCHLDIIQFVFVADMTCLRSCFLDGALFDITPNSCLNWRCIVR